MADSVQRSTKDWQAFLGAQCRELRVRANLTQSELAEHAALSVGAVKLLERGVGSSLVSLIKILRVLKRTDWLAALAPPVSVSPLQALRAQRASAPRERVRKPKASGTR